MSVVVAVAPRADAREVREELEFASPPPGMMDLRRFALKRT